MPPVFNVVVNLDGELQELAHFEEPEARALCDWLTYWLYESDDPPDNVEPVEELRERLNKWLGEEA